MLARLCDTEASVERDGEAPHPLTGQSALLLRLLSLWPEELVSHDLIAHVLDVAQGSVHVYVGTLRAEIGDTDRTLIASARGRGFRSFVPTDATQVRESFRHALKLADQRDFKSLDVEDAAEIAGILDAALAVWKGSPATGLDHAASRKANASKLRSPHEMLSTLTKLESVFDEWVDLHTDALVLRADCWLAGGRGGRDAKQVVRTLLPLAQRAAPDEEIWPRLLTAATRLNDRKRHSDVWALLEKAYTGMEEAIPDELLTLSPAEPVRPVLPAGREDASNSMHPLTSEEATLLGLASLLGITSTSALKLRGSRLEPIECIERAEHTLFFAGVLAGKWVGDRHTFQQFQEMLQRFQARTPRGDVRFLVIHPDSSAYRRLEQMRAGEANFRSVNILVRLAQRYPCLKVRGIHHLPCFRVIVVDEDIVSFSPYDLENESVQSSRQGWAAPHVVLDPFAPFPLAPAFRSHFQSEWDVAEPIEEEFR